jgi:hypothetical protein
LFQVVAGKVGSRTPLPMATGDFLDYESIMIPNPSGLRVSNIFQQFKVKLSDARHPLKQPLNIRNHEP